MASAGTQGSSADPRPVGDEDRFLKVYGELRALAAQYLREERDGHTLRATELVHELYLRLNRGQPPRTADTAGFFLVAAHGLRQLLVEHARKRRAGKRCGRWKRITLADAADSALEFDLLDMVALDDALTRLAAERPQLGAVVELRFFAGLDVRETARELGLPHSTVNDQWRYARAWLHRELFGEQTP